MNEHMQRIDSKLEARKVYDQVKLVHERLVNLMVELPTVLALSNADEVIEMTLRRLSDSVDEALRAADEADQAAYNRLSPHSCQGVPDGD